MTPLCEPNDHKWDSLRTATVWPNGTFQQSSAWICHTCGVRIDGPFPRVVTRAELRRAPREIVEART